LEIAKKTVIFVWIALTFACYHKTFHDFNREKWEIGKKTNEKRLESKRETSAKAKRLTNHFQINKFLHYVSEQSNFSRKRGERPGDEVF
jgi:hypothetical protein